MLAADVVDRERYPMPAPAALVSSLSEELRSTGVCIMPGFVRPEVMQDLVAESRQLAASAHLSDVWGTPYLALPDDAYTDGHPRRALVRTRLRAVAYDLFPSGSLLRRLYEWDGLMAFVGSVLGRSPLHRYADPMGALNLAVMEDGDELGWHYDQTDFVVSLAIQSSDAGGDFECVRQIRSASSEQYPAVSALLNGTSDGVETVPMTPGTLMLFEGRYSIHRVTPVVGTVPRYVGLLAYDTKPGTVSSSLLRQVRYGRDVDVDR